MPAKSTLTIKALSGKPGVNHKPGKSSMLCKLHAGGDKPSALAHTVLAQPQADGFQEFESLAYWLLLIVSSLFLTLVFRVCFMYMYIYVHS